MKRTNLPLFGSRFYFGLKNMNTRKTDSLYQEGVFFIQLHLTVLKEEQIHATPIQISAVNLRKRIENEN